MNLRKNGVGKFLKNKKIILGSLRRILLRILATLAVTVLINSLTTVVCSDVTTIALTPSVICYLDLYQKCFMIIVYMVLKISLTKPPCEIPKIKIT